MNFKKKLFVELKIKRKIHTNNVSVHITGNIAVTTSTIIGPNLFILDHIFIYTPVNEDDVTETKKIDINLQNISCLRLSHFPCAPNVIFCVTGHEVSLGCICPINLLCEQLCQPLIRQSFGSQPVLQQTKAGA